MVPEILFLLSGHPSVLVSPSPSASDATGYVIAPAYTEGHFHPGEVGSLTTLALLGFRYRKVDSWIARAQAQARKEILRSSAPHRSTERTSTADDGHGQVEDWQYLTGMCTRLRSVLDEYQELILFTEQRMLAEDDGFCGEDAGFIPLSTLLATYAAWQTKMAALENLVDTLQRGPSGPVPVQPSSKPSSSTPPVPLWPPGPLITLLHTLHFESETSLAKTYLQLSHAVQLPFLSQLLVFLLYGQPCSLAYDAGADPLATHRRTYALREGAIPDVIGGQVRESMLWVGRAVAVVRKEGRELPPDVKTRLEGEVRSVWVEDEANFKAVVEQVRAEVGDWLWRNILTMKDVKRTIDAFGDIFLGRDGELALAFVREVEELKITKLTRTHPSSTAAIIREQDINLALLRASVGTASASNSALEKVHFVLEKGPLRPFLPSVAPSSKQAAPQTPASASDSSSASLKMFSSHLLGTPLILTSTLTWPLDLFLTPPALQSYSTVFAFLTAMRRTHTRVLGLWLSLSGAQRTRRKWTGVGEGGEENRKRVARMGWGVVRLMVWFLDTLLSHFQTDVIEVQHRAFLAKLDNATTSTQPTFAAQQDQSVPPTLQTQRFSADVPQRASSAASTAPPSPSRHRGGPSHLARRLPPRAPSPLVDPLSAATPSAPPSTHFSASQTARTSPFPPSPTSTGPQLDFLTLRMLHCDYLSVLQDGLLLSHPEIARTIKDVLDVCERLVGIVERWGGDVLPGLLEVEIEEEGAARVGQEVDRRGAVVVEIRDSLEASLHTFFTQIAPVASAPNSSVPANTSNTSTTSHAAGPDASFAALTLTSNGASQPSKQPAQARSGGGTVASERERAELEADIASRRHLEQLASKLEFLGNWFAGPAAEDDEAGESEEDGEEEPGVRTDDEY